MYFNALALALPLSASVLILRVYVCAGHLLAQCMQHDEMAKMFVCLFMRMKTYNEQAWVRVKSEMIERIAHTHTHTLTWHSFGALSFGLLVNNCLYTHWIDTLFYLGSVRCSPKKFLQVCKWTGTISSKRGEFHAQKPHEKQADRNESRGQERKKWKIQSGMELLH